MAAHVESPDCEWKRILFNVLKSVFSSISSRYLHAHMYTCTHIRAHAHKAKTHYETPFLGCSLDKGQQRELETVVCCNFLC